MRDSEFISGEFFEYEVPKEKQYLLKYFTTDLQQAFLRYYLVFEDIYNFVDHTGYYCSMRLLWKFKRRYHYLTSVYSRAKSALTEESMMVVEQLESGRFSLQDKW